MGAQRWSIWLGIVLLLGIGWIWASRVPEGGESVGIAPRVGFLAPDFTLQTVDQEMVSLSELRGQPVLVNFWATWCAPCRAEMPALQRVADRHREDGLVVLLINQGEDPGLIQQYLTTLGVQEGSLLDPELETTRRYRVNALPTTYFIARDGTVNEMTIGGPMTEAYLLSQVSALLRAP